MSIRLRSEDSTAHHFVCVNSCLISFSGLYSLLQYVLFTPCSVFFTQCFMTHCKLCMTFTFLSRNRKSCNSSGLESELWMFHCKTSPLSHESVTKSSFVVFLLFPIQIQSVLFLILNLDLIVLPCVKILRLIWRHFLKQATLWD